VTERRSAFILVLSLSLKKCQDTIGGLKTTSTTAL